MKRMFDKHNPPWNVILYVLAFAVIAFALAAGMIGCNTQIPPIDVTFWAGDSEHGGVTRKQDNETILVADPKFDQMACMTYADVRKIYATLLTCKDWGDQPKMSAAQVKNLLDKNSEIVTRVANQERK